MSDPREVLERRSFDPEAGHAVEITDCGGKVTLELGERRRVGAFSAEAWITCSPAEARVIADELRDAARRIERDVR